MTAPLRDGPSGPLAGASAMPPGVIQVPNLATLSLLAPSNRVTDGCLAYVQTLKRCFQLDRPSTDVPLGGQRVSATGGGVWRSTTYYSPEAGPWSSRADWHVDAVIGTVEGDGSAASPVSSWVELQSRIAGQQLPASTVISIHSDLAEAVDLSDLVPDPATGMTITGEPGATTALSGLVGTYTAESLAAPGEAPRLTSVAAPDWTPWVGYRCRFTNGPASQALCIIAKEAPNGLGINVARISRPVLPSYPYAVDKTPAVGNSFVLETLPRVTALIAKGGTARAPTIVRGLALPDTVGPPNDLQSGGHLALVGCTMGDVMVRANYLNAQGCRIGTPLGWGCGLYSGQFDIKGCVIYWGAIYGAAVGAAHVVFQGGLYISSGQHLLNHCGCFDDTAGDGLCLTMAGVYVSTASVLYGSANSDYGVRVVRSMSGLTYTGKPVIAGTINSFQICGVANAWAAAPIVDAAHLAAITTP